MRASVGCKWIEPISIEDSEGSKVPFIYPDCATVGHMSDECGTSSLYNILLRTGQVWKELHNEQPLTQIYYIENCGCLDPLVEREIQLFLGVYGYHKSLSMCSNDKLNVSAGGDITNGDIPLTIK